jgi:hypothetical protein
VPLARHRRNAPSSELETVCSLRFERGRNETWRSIALEALLWGYRITAVASFAIDGCFTHRFSGRDAPVHASARTVVRVNQARHAASQRPATSSRPQGNQQSLRTSGPGR